MGRPVRPQLSQRIAVPQRSVGSENQLMGQGKGAETRSQGPPMRGHAGRCGPGSIRSVKWLSWRWGLGGALVALIVWYLIGLIKTEKPALQFTRSFAREFSIVSGLYALWNLGGRIQAFGADQAIARGERLWDFQQWIGLPSEDWLQEMILPSEWLVKAANIYYATAHVPAFGAVLVWMFFSHRGAYPAFRTQMALFTGTSLLIQLVAVAPPRFVDATGMIDTAILYNQSVYSALGRESVGQLQAMPSIHVGWALFVGILTLRFASRWWVKVIGVSHAVVTWWVVMVTANHFWMDGIVAAGIMGFWFLVFWLLSQSRPA